MPAMYFYRQTNLVANQGHSCRAANAALVAAEAARDLEVDDALLAKRVYEKEQKEAIDAMEQVKIDLGAPPLVCIL